jgi:hypothetical protein
MQAITSKQAHLASAILAAVQHPSYTLRSVSALAVEAKATEADIVTTARQLGLTERSTDTGLAFGLAARLNGNDVKHYPVAPQAARASSSGSGCCTSGRPQSRDESKCAILEALKDTRWTQRSIGRLAQIGGVDEYTARQLARELGARVSGSGQWVSLPRRY